MDEPLSDLDGRLDTLATLGDPVRRALYAYVAGQGEAVGRDEAADAAGISRSLAAYHLDKLVAAGLLDTRFERRTGRQGPGAGRTAKLYLRARGQVEISVPARDFEFIAGLLARAIEADVSGAAQAALNQAARDLGREIGQRARSAGNGDAVPILRRLLAERGYEPYEEAGVTRLRNCPFGRLVDRHRPLVCGANLAVVEGVVEALGAVGIKPALDPRPHECCIAVTAAPA